MSPNGDSGFECDRPVCTQFPTLHIDSGQLPQARATTALQNEVPAVRGRLNRNRPMRLQEGTYLAHRQRNPLLGLLPRI